MLTAMQDKSYVNAAFAKGASDYVVKPFDPFDLGMRLEKNLAQSKVAAPDATSFRPETFCQESDCLVTFDSLKNYLRQMKRCAVENAVVALRVENFDELQSELTADALFAHLHRVARKLMNHLGENFSLTTFLEKGTFLIVSQGPTAQFDKLFRADFESSVNLHQFHETRIKISEAVRCRKFKEVDDEEVIAQVMQSLENAPRRRLTLSQFGLQTVNAAQ
jgi:CheY-like chemotaxis protein